MKKTAYQYGIEMKRLGVLGPMPIVKKSDLLKNIQVYRIGNRCPKNVFVLVNNSYASIYVNPKYSSYRNAYKNVFFDNLQGCDVDHLFPRSKVKNNQFVVIGNISAKINRSQNDTIVSSEIIMKAMDRSNDNAWTLTKTPRAIELGRFVQNGYLRPFNEINNKVLTLISKEKIRNIF